MTGLGDSLQRYDSGYLFREASIRRIHRLFSELGVGYTGIRTTRSVNRNFEQVWICVVQGRVQ